MTDQLDQPLRAVVEFLEDNGYRYAVIGGIALAYWGVVRTTYDVDAASVEDIITQFAAALDNPKMLDEYLAIVRKTQQIN